MLAHVRKKLALIKTTKPRKRRNYSESDSRFAKTISLADSIQNTHLDPRNSGAGCASKEIDPTNYAN